METKWLESKHGYRIPCRDNWEGQDRVVIVCHGFGSGKSSPTVQALDETLPRHGMGVFSFDFPAHGESPAGEESLRVPFCIDDLETVEAYLRSRSPKIEVSYFGSSFGAYITLLRLARHPRPQAKAFLRSAAVTMPRLVDTWVDERAQADLDRQGYFVPDYDYVREMRITPAFLQDLADHDVFSRYQKGQATLAMIHGGQDSVAPAADARRFAETFGARLTLVPRGEHQLMGPGELEQVLDRAVSFFQG